MTYRTTITIIFTLAIASSAHIASAATMQVSRPWVQASGLVGYWSFNNLDLTDKVYDRSGQGNDAYFEGGATSSAKVPGRLGQGMRFDGVDDVVNIPTFNNTYSSMTITVWVRSRTDGAAYRGIVFSRNYPDISGLQMSDVFPGTTVAYVWNGSLSWNSGLVLPQDEWSFVALTVSPSLGTVYVGTNTGLATATNATAHGPATFNDLKFGLDWDAPSYWIGDIDEVRIYNRALTPAEVNALYRAGSAAVAKTLSTSVKNGLVGWWTFDGKDVRGTAPSGANTGSILPGTGGTLTGGSLFWGSAGNITADDGLRASVTLSGTAQSDYLRASNFGFSIPADATIVGIEGDIKRRRSGGTTGQARDYSVRLVDDTGAFVGNDKANTGFNWPTTEEWACMSPGCYGSPSDTWSTSLTPAQVNDPDFGMAVQVNGAAAGADRIAEVGAVDMVVYYTIPGGAVDRSGSGNHGTLTSGVKSSAGRIGQAMSFDGVDDYISLTTDIVDVNTVTVCAWIYPNRVTGQFQTIVGNNRFTFGIYSGGSGELWLDSNTSIGSRLTGSVLTAKEWQHVCAVRQSGANGPATLYINGNFDVSGNSDTPVTSGLPLTISEAYATYVFDGNIDDVRIYNRALSAAEIKKIYTESGGITVGKSKSGLVPSGLVGYWSFNGPDFTDRVYDRSGQGNHGDVFGTATSTVKAIGKIGQGAYLDGAVGTIDFADTASLQLASSGSIALWVKPKELEPDWDVLVNHIRFTTDRNGYALFIDRTQDGSHFNLEIANASSFDRITSASSARVGEWQFVVGTWDGSNLRIYVDGVQEGSPVPQTVNATPSYALNFGSDIFNAYHPNGTIDEVRIYNRALTAAEVKRLYQAGK